MITRLPVLIPDRVEWPVTISVINSLEQSAYPALPTLKKNIKYDVLTLFIMDLFLLKTHLIVCQARLTMFKDRFSAGG